VTNTKITLVKTIKGQGQQPAPNLSLQQGASRPQTYSLYLQAQYYSYYYNNYQYYTKKTTKCSVWIKLF